MKKRILTLLLALLMLAALPAAAFAASPISVTVNGTAVKWTDATPYVDKNSRTMVPLRAVGEALGLTVSWNGAAREAIFSNGSKTIYFPIDKKYYKTQNGGTVTMDTAAVVSKGRTYAPVRYLAEYFGYTVSWNGSTKTVGITGGAQPRWVLVGSSFTVSPDTDNGYFHVTRDYEGVFDGMVRFRRSGGYFQDDSNYYRSDDYYECQQPPATLTPGQAITLQMKTTVENYEHASSSGTKAGVHADSSWLQGNGPHFTDVKNKNNTYLTVPTTGNLSVSGTFTGTVQDSSTIGAKYEIKYCINNTGTFTWTYELRK